MTTTAGSAPRDVDLPAPEQAGGPDEIPTRKLGTTGLTVSAIGLGGYHLGLAGSQDEAVRILREAVDAGVTFLDNAWEYNGGRSEEWMGAALRGGYRDRVVLMTKVCTHGRDRAVAMQQLDESLRRLGTDHLDVWQIHECIYYNDPELHFAPGGVVEALQEARNAGKVRFVGFTGHKDPAIHLRMLELADRHQFHFDTIQMPLNCFDATYLSFARTVLPEALKRRMAPLGMKSLGGSGEPVQQGAVTPGDALRYAMSLPAAVTISGIESLEVLRQNLALARGFVPLDAGRMQTIRQKCAPAAGDGHLEMYKSTRKYDGDLGRHQHGFPSMQELPL